jgi:outer membrane protein assembly factor BamB
MLPHASALSALLAALLLTGSLARPAAAQDWPRFLGPNGSGASSTTGLPDSFGPEENLRWRTPVVAGQSSPVLGTDAVFLTGADEDALVVLCLERATGAPRWERRLARAQRQEVHPANGSATPTPTSDGTNVYAFFPELGLVAFDAEGTERWRLPLGPFVSFYGMAASPILAGDTLVLLCDQQQGSFLLAVDVTSGKPRWRAERAGMIESWTTPVLYPSDDAPRSIVVFGSYFVCAYALDSGKELWRQGGVGYTPVCSPALAAGGEGEDAVLVASVPFHAEQPLPGFADLLAADADGDGKLARSEVDGSELAEHFGWADGDRDGFIVAAEWELVSAGMSSKDYGCVGYVLGADGTPREKWRHKRGLPSIASPLVADGVVYLIKEGGMLTTLDAASGAELGFERLADAPGGFDASPVTADGKVYLASSEGRILVLSAGAKPEILARCDLGEEIDATPALGGGALFVRTDAALYCFARGE